MKIQYFCEFEIFAMFRKQNCGERNFKLQTEDSDSDAEDSVLVLDSVAEDSGLGLGLGRGGIDHNTVLCTIAGIWRVTK